MINQGDDAILLDKEGVRDSQSLLDFEQVGFPFTGVCITLEVDLLGTMLLPGATRVAQILEVLIYSKY